jgi:CBS domain-containing protein
MARRGEILLCDPTCHAPGMRRPRHQTRLAFKAQTYRDHAKARYGLQLPLFREDDGEVGGAAQDSAAPQPVGQERPVGKRKEPVIMNAVAKDILTPHVACVTEDMAVRTAAQLLRTEAITGAPVVDERGQVVGIISQSDLVSHGLTAPPDERLVVTVKDVMTPRVVTVEEETPLHEVALRMVQQGIHRVLVVDKAQQLRGIVTSMDILWWVAAQG